MQEGCLLYGGRSFYYVTGIIASLLINVFEDNSIECERQGRYDKIICKLRKQKKKREYRLFYNDKSTCEIDSFSII